MQWNNEVKVAVRRKETGWKEMLAASNEEVKKDIWKIYGSLQRRKEKG